MDTIIYSRENLSLEEVYTALSSKEKMKEINPGHEPKAAGLNARVRSPEKGSTSYHNKSRSKSHGKTKKFCNFCKRKGQIINKAKNNSADSSGEAGVAENDAGGASDGEVLMVSGGNTKTSEEWILDSGCTFHMCPKRSWYHTYELVPDGGYRCSV